MGDVKLLKTTTSFCKEEEENKPGFFVKKLATPFNLFLKNVSGTTHHCDELMLL